MTLLRSLPLVLLLLTACRPPEDIDAPPPSDAEFGEDDGSRFKADKDKMRKARDKGEEGDESRLSRNGLGKEDFALVEAELACVREHYAADEKLLPLAEAAVYQRYGASEQWVERVRVHLKSEGKYRGKIEDSVALRKNQVCPNGKLGNDMLEALDTLLRADGGEGLLPIDEPAGETAPEGEAKPPEDEAKPAEDEAKPTEADAKPDDAAQGKAGEEGDATETGAPE